MNKNENKISGNLKYVENEEKLNIGGHIIECITAPGHTPGSMLFLVDDLYLFTGDAFRVTNNKISLHPYTADKKAAQESISNLDEILDKCELILTAHYGVYSSEKVQDISFQ